MYSICHIGEIVKGRFLNFVKDATISELSYDTRKLQNPSGSLFFALKTAHSDGHKFIKRAYASGVRNFIVSDENVGNLKDANIILVDDTLKALQSFAAFHRSQHKNLKVIAITGSNGKTIVKEWLNLLLGEEYNIVRSPRSFNSKIGVPLSVWGIGDMHELGIFEAGISEAGEMDNLEKIIQPQIGILTNIGAPHSEGFLNDDQKFSEKIKLFQNANVIIGRAKDFEQRLHSVHQRKDQQILLWGSAEHNSFFIQSLKQEGGFTLLQLKFNTKHFTFRIPFLDAAYVENTIHCICTLLHFGYGEDIIKKRLPKLHPIDMRLQLSKGGNGCTIINDSYSADLSSLQIALDFLSQQAAGQPKTVILSDFAETESEKLYQSIAELLKQNGIKKIIAIGEKINEILPPYLDKVTYQHFLSTEDFIQHFRPSEFRDEIILIKGARRFAFERLVAVFDQQVHQTLLQINLNAIAHNLKQYQKLLKPGTKVMAMVKAFAYGSGGAEIANVLQYNNADYLGVAYADEGVELRKAGIYLPIMVMNAENNSFPVIVEFGLQPVLYSTDIFLAFKEYIQQQGLQSYPVHIEVETGMNRLGFLPQELAELKEHLDSTFKIESVFTHLAASEDEMQDEFTQQQAQTFHDAVSTIQSFVDYNFLKHTSNSAAIIRHPQLSMDMVRLGIGLYGVEIATEKLQLHPVATLKSTIAQIKKLKPGDTVSYNRRGIIKEDTVIATVRIGYADGYSRKFGNGVGKMWVNGHLAPVVGTICMDMTMINITDIPDCKAGDEVVLFGKELSIQQLADWGGTIAYEIMTSVSQRVKRIYYNE